MVRLKRAPRPESDPVRDHVRAVAERAVAIADAKLAEGPPPGWADGIYAWQELWAERTNRRRLQQLDAGEPILVGKWELPGGTGIPAHAHNYLAQPGGQLTVAESMNDDTVENARRGFA